MSFDLVLKAEFRLMGSVRVRSDVYERVHHTARDLVPLDAFYICLYEPKNRRLSFEYNGDEGGLDTVEEFALGQGPTSRAIRSGRPLVMNQLHDEREKTVTFGDHGRRSRGAIHLPFWDGPPGVRGNGPAMGVISVQSYSLETYESRHLDSIRWLACRTVGMIRETDARTRIEAARLAEAAERCERRRQRVLSILDAHAVTSGLRADVLASLADGFETSVDPRVLSDRELQCAALAAQGLTYRRIADTLVIGDETVKTYMRKVYPKLGMPNGRLLALHLPTLVAALDERDL